MTFGAIWNNGTFHFETAVDYFLGNNFKNWAILISTSGRTGLRTEKT